jgi:hypothetical protein
VPNSVKFIRPCIPQPPRLSRGDAWLHEPKLDGWGLSTIGMFHIYRTRRQGSTMHIQGRVALTERPWMPMVRSPPLIRAVGVWDAAAARLPPGIIYNQLDLIASAQAWRPNQILLIFLHND